MSPWSNNGDKATLCILQKVLSLGSDYFSATFYQTYFYYETNLQSIPPLVKHIFVTFYLVAKSR